MKKEKSPILVVFTMMFLLMFIVLPPIFRSLFPNEENITNNDVSKITIVICNNTYSSELYRVNSRTKYTGDGDIQNTITYQKIESSEQAVEGTTQSTATIANELSYFRSIPNLDIIDSGDSIVVKINQKEITNNPNEEKLKNHLNNTPKLQKVFYENLGYRCNILES